MRSIVYIIMLVLMSHAAMGQYYSFSQYFLDKLSVSPAFVSVGDYSEVGASVRSQWPGMDGGYRIYMAEYQQKLPGISSGLGARFFGDAAGAYGSTGASLLYGYDFSIIYDIKCSLGLEAGYWGRSLRQQDLVYHSMIDPYSGNALPINDLVSADGYGQLFFSSGMVLYTKRTLLALGVSNMAGVALGAADAYPLGISLMLNHKIVISGNPDRERQFLVPCISYSHTRMGDMLMPGVYYSGLKLLISMAYRINMGEYGGSGAVVSSIGFDLGRLELGIGHDFETSRVLRQAHGATEVGVKYKF